MMLGFLAVALGRAASSDPKTSWLAPLEIVSQMRSVEQYRVITFMFRPAVAVESGFRIVPLAPQGPEFRLAIQLTPAILNEIESQFHYQLGVSRFLVTLWRE